MRAVISGLVAGIVVTLPWAFLAQANLDHWATVVFGLAHFNHPGVVAMMPFYLTLAATYGTIAYLTNSILPGIVLHAGGDALGAMTVLTEGRQTSSLPLPAASTASMPLPFLILLLIAVVASALFAFRALAQMVHVTDARAIGSRSSAT